MLFLLGQVITQQVIQRKHPQQIFKIQAQKILQLLLFLSTGLALNQVLVTQYLGHLMEAHLLRFLKIILRTVLKLEPLDELQFNF